MFSHYSCLATFVPLIYASVAYSSVLVDFQVAQPPPFGQDATQCTVQIFEHTFGNSYYVPAIANYTPPTDCGEVGSWAGISLNFTVTSNGTQYDRLGLFKLQNVEIWRTSTPEPTTDGIIWTYIKDVTRYIPLFSEDGLLIVELDNLLEDDLDGEYASTLEATFYAFSTKYPTASKADVILPINTISNTSGEAPAVPDAFSLNVTIPQNTVGIYAELYASGNSEEEFWYYNVPNDYLDDLPSGFTYGYGSFREVQLLVDGQLAGVAFPYPVIFTGGIIPTAWQPITSYGALDQPTYFIDVTPFVPLLTDGESHTFTLNVVSAETDHLINSDWYVSASLQIVTSSSTEPTTGKITLYNVEPYADTYTNGALSSSGDFVVTVAATRSLQIEAEIVSGDGEVTYVLWTQNLEFSNTQYYLDDYDIQNVAQTTSGSFLSTHNGVTVLQDDFSYPFNINLTVLNEEGTEFDAVFDHSYDRYSLPSPFILGTTISEHQIATGYFEETDSGNYGNGTSTNTFNYADNRGNTFYWDVVASDDTITYEERGGSLDTTSGSYTYSTPAPASRGPFTKPRLPGGKTSP